MKILMLSWGVLPQKTGGLEKVTFYLCKVLGNLDNKIFLIIPNKTKDIEIFTEKKLKNLKVIGSNIDISPILSPYPSYHVLLREVYKKGLKTFFATLSDYLKVVKDYTEKTIKILERLKIDFDIIYAHDWLTGYAGMKIKEIYNKPFVVHIHATAYDRCGANPHILEYLDDYKIEKEMCLKADKVIVVSKRIKKILIKYYEIPAEKIEVVYNAPDYEIKGKGFWHYIKSHYKVVLYLGRMSLHKGPDWLLKSAKKVLEKRKDVIFVFAGGGEMLPQVINLAAELGISRNIIFTGRVSDEEAELLYDIADIFVLPSVSEPFGLTPFEALSHHTPVIISKQSGVAEVLSSALKVDFWDVNKIADYILALLEYPKLADVELMNCLKEMKSLSWEDSGRKIEKIFKGLVKC